MNLTARLTETPLVYNKKKVNMADPYVPWAHEQFARKKIVSASLSHVAAAPLVCWTAITFMTLQ